MGSDERSDMMDWKASRGRRKRERRQRSWTALPPFSCGTSNEEESSTGEGIETRELVELG
jgi:hypothetical protein